MQVNSEVKLQRSPDGCWGVLDTAEGEQLALWLPTERRLRVLNRTAASVWKLFDRPRSQSELVDVLVEAYQSSRETIEGDVSPLLDELEAAGLLCGSTTAKLSIVESAPATNCLPVAESGFATIGPIRALGSSIVVRVEDAEVHETLSGILAPLCVVEAGVESSALINRAQIEIVVAATQGQLVVTRNGEFCAQSSNREHILRTVLAEVNSAPLELVQQHVVLHAAGAEFPGRTSSGEQTLVVFPGVSNAGKSTLVTQLCLRGHGYLTDEAVAIRVDSLEAQPFHKSICIEFSAQNVLGELAEAVATPALSKTWDIDPRLVGPGRLASAGRIDAIVFPKFSHESATNIKALEPFEVLQRLIANAFDFAAVGQPAFASLVRLANTVPAFALDHGGDGTQLDELERLFGSTAPSPIRQ